MVNYTELMVMNYTELMKVTARVGIQFDNYNPGLLTKLKIDLQIFSVSSLDGSPVWPNIVRLLKVTEFNADWTNILSINCFIV